MSARDKIYLLVLNKKSLDILNNKIKYHIDASFTCISNEGLKYLLRFDEINLKYCHEITVERLKYLTNVSKLNLRSCYEITDEGLKYLTNAVHLNLDNCPKITDVGIRNLINVTNLNICLMSLI